MADATEADVFEIIDFTNASEWESYAPTTAHQHSLINANKLFVYGTYLTLCLLTDWWPKSRRLSDGGVSSSGAAAPMRNGRRVLGMKGCCRCGDESEYRLPAAQPGRALGRRGKATVTGARRRRAHHVAPAGDAVWFHAL